MAIQQSRKKRGLTRVVVLFGVFLLAMLITITAVYWRLISADTKKRLNMESARDSSVPIVSTVPTLPPKLVISRPSYNIPSSVSFGKPNIVKLPSSASFLSQSVATSSPASLVMKADVSAKEMVKVDVPAKEIVKADVSLKETVKTTTPSSAAQTPPPVETPVETVKPKEQKVEGPANRLRTDEAPASVVNSCEQTPLGKMLNGYSLLSASDFDCSISNAGWEQHLPPLSSNTSRAQRNWKKRLALLKSFSERQDSFSFDDSSKYVVFWPIFAGIGNNIAVFTEALLIALMSNRKFLVYNWNSLREYFYLPFQYEVITEKVWERDPNTLMVEKSNECPFDTVAACHGEVDAKFIVLRSTCLTIQNLVKNKNDKRWFAEQGVTPKTLSGPKEVVHHINRFLYREVMTPREKVAEAIEAFKKETAWSEHFVIGMHVRTGSVNKERVRWGRFLAEDDVKLFKEYMRTLTRAYESGGELVRTAKKSESFVLQALKEKEAKKLPVKWYVLSDQDGIKEAMEKENPEYVIETRCVMSHTNQALKNKDDPGFMCALVESYLLSDTDMMVLTKRSTYGNLARHRTHAPFVTVDMGDYKKWKKMDAKERAILPVEYWDVSDL